MRPNPKKIKFEINAHGDTRNDPYYWMRNRKEDPDVEKYLLEENEYLNEFLKSNSELKDKLFNELKSYVKENDESYPYKDGDFFYYYKYEEGKEYPIHFRRSVISNLEELILDENVLAKGRDFLDVADFDISQSDEILAYVIDDTGDEKYTMYFKNLKTGKLLEDKLETVYTSMAWYKDSKTILYTLLDSDLRPYKIMSHDIGTKQSEDKLVYEESNPGEYFLSIGETMDGEYLIISATGQVDTYNLISKSRSSNEKFFKFSELENNIEQYVDHKDGYFYILTNDEERNFRILKTPVDKIDKKNWQELVRGNKDQYISNMVLFKDFMTYSYRELGLTKFKVVSNSGESSDINFPDEAYSAEFGDNNEYETSFIRFQYSTLKDPPSILDYDVETKKLETKKVKEVPGHNPDDYILERKWAESHDGVMIPLSICYKKGTKLDGSSKAYLYGYGSYGISLPPYFTSNIYPLVDRGFVFCMAHIRGSNTLGQQWYEDGKYLKKKNTFLDFISSANFLIKNKYTDKSQIVIRGGSAGGLLVGASMNMAPEGLFKTCIAEVPFVDVLTTMLDSELPLTQIEYKEWGNPEKNKEYYEYIKTYSPYDNIEGKNYPHFLATAGLNDPRVTYWEPAKFVAKLRELNTSNSHVHLYTNMDAGHGGASGRFEYLKELAMVYHFILKTFEISE